MSFDEVFGERQEAYQRLLEDAMVGDTRRFGRADALAEQWRIFEPALASPHPVSLYHRGTWGPSVADTLAVVGGRLARAAVARWRRHSLRRCCTAAGSTRGDPLHDLPRRSSSGRCRCAPSGWWWPSGVLLGAWLAARYGEEHGIPRDTTYSLAMRMVVAGVIGSRITWVLSHLDELESPLDAIAIWQGGLQFSGGFVFAVIAGYPVYRHWNRLTRWHSLDGYAYGLTIGLGIGRIGCYAVGEHFGSLTSFPLGGPLRRRAACARSSSAPSRSSRGWCSTRPRSTSSSTWWCSSCSSPSCSTCRKPRPGPGVAMAIFCGFYGVARFASDSLRVNDETLLGLTGAQYLCLALLPDQRLDLVPRPQAARAATSQDGMPVGHRGTRTTEPRATAEAARAGRARARAYARCP